MNEAQDAYRKQLAEGIVAGYEHETEEIACLLEDVIEARGLHDAYIRALLPHYHSFEAMTTEELFIFLRTPPEQRARAYLAVTTERSAS